MRKLTRMHLQELGDVPDLVLTTGRVVNNDPAVVLLAVLWSTQMGGIGSCQNSVLSFDSEEQNKGSRTDLHDLFGRDEAFALCDRRPGSLELDLLREGQVRRRGQQGENRELGAESGEFVQVSKRSDVGQSFSDAQGFRPWRKQKAVYSLLPLGPWETASSPSLNCLSCHRLAGTRCDRRCPSSLRAGGLVRPTMTVDRSEERR